MQVFRVDQVQSGRRQRCGEPSPRDPSANSPGRDPAHGGHLRHGQKVHAVT